MSSGGQSPPALDAIEPTAEPIDTGREMGRAHPLMLVLTLAGAACEPATLGGGDPTGTGGQPATATQPQPPPVTSCAGGTVEASGATADGIFLATAVTVRGTACRDWSSAAISIAGNHAAVF